MEQQNIDQRGPSSRKRNRCVCSSARGEPGIIEMPTQQERRDGQRVSYIRVCPYELTALSGTDVIKLSEGRAFTINMSVGGMLLLLPQSVGERQVFEVKAPSVADEKQTTKLVEVRWTRPLPVKGHTTLHLAGVRFLFEAPSK